MSNITEKELSILLERYKKLIGDYNQKTPNISYNDSELNTIINQENLEILKKIKFSDNVDDIIVRYHQSEIDNNKKITGLVIGTVIVGLLFLGIGIVGTILNFLQESYITLVAGGVTELIGASIQGIQTISNNSKRKYFESLQKQQRRRELFKIVESQKDGTAKTKMINKLIDGYYNEDKEQEKT